jgi:ribosomal protein L12E/L44/L45/RPP1/RPP2
MKTILAMVLAGAFLISLPARAGTEAAGDKAAKGQTEKTDKKDEKKADKKDEKKDEKKADKGW